MKLIELTQGFYAIVDDKNYFWLNSYKWHYVNKQGKGYAYRAINGKNVGMHQVIMNAPDGLQVDHKNTNTLDNRTENLRIATHQQNCQNRKVSSNPNKTSKYKGVSLRKSCISKPWRASITRNKQTIQLGFYTTEIEAARAYDKAAIELFGEFAWLNFPQNTLPIFNI